jgi:hypothetical protein
VPRAAIALLVALAAAFAPAAPAGAQDSGQAVIDRAARALQSAPVYQDPAAETKLSDAELSELRRLVGDQSVPIYIALLPASAGAADGVVQDLGEAVGRRGTYGVVVDNRFRAGSNTQRTGVAPAESRAAFRAHRDEGVAAVLEDFVRRTAQPGLQAPGAGDGGSGSGSGDGGGGVPWFLVIILGVLGFFGFRAFGQRRRQREADEAAFADVRRTAEDDIAAIANDITELDDDVEAAGAPP